MAKKGPKIFIHLVTWNSMKFLPDCLRSIFEQTYKNFSVLIVDNGSNDGVVDYLTNNFPEVKVFRNNKNIGFGAAHNQAIKIISLNKDNIENNYVLVINADIILEKDYLKNLITILEKDKEIGAITGKILKVYTSDPEINEKNKTQNIDSTGLKIFRSKKVIDRGENEIDRGQYDNEGQVFGLSGACALYRLAALEDIKIPLIRNSSKTQTNADGTQTNAEKGQRLPAQAGKSASSQRQSALTSEASCEVHSPISNSYIRNKLVPTQVGIPTEVGIISRGAIRQPAESGEVHSPISNSYIRNELVISRGAIRQPAESGEVFDEDFFAYKEDIDLSYRLRWRGWKIYYYPAAVCYHHRQVFSGRQKILDLIRRRRVRSPLIKIYSYRNDLFLLIKNVSFVNFLKDFPFIFFYELKKFLYIFFFEPKTLKGLREFFAKMDSMIKKRRFIMKNKKIKSKDLRRWLK